MATKSKPLLWLQLIISLIIIAWLSYDFFHTIFNGLTYTLRFDNQIAFKDNAIPFVIAVVIKLGFYYFFISLSKRLFSKIKS